MERTRRTRLDRPPGRLTDEGGSPPHRAGGPPVSHPYGPPRCELLARARSGRARQVASVVHGHACERSCAPVAVRPAVGTRHLRVEATRLDSRQPRLLCGVGLFVPKPSSQTSVVRILLSNLGLSVRQRPLVHVGVCGDRHSVSHSAQPSRSNAGLSVSGQPADTGAWADLPVTGGRGFPPQCSLCSPGDDHERRGRVGLWLRWRGARDNRLVAAGHDAAHGASFGIWGGRTEQERPFRARGAP